MYSIIYTIFMVALWGINLLNGTGMGIAYKTTEWASVIALVVAILCVAFRSLREGDIYIPHRYFYTLLPMVLVFVGSSLLNGAKLEGLEGFWVYLLIFILSKTRPNTTAIRMTCICYGVLGLVVLYVYDYMTILKGWNANTIAMIGLFSFLFFTIPFFGMKDWRSFIFMPLVGTAYVVLILPTDSRSCILIIFIMLLLVLRIIPIKHVLASNKGLVLMLLVPLAVLLSVCLFSLFGDMSGLTQWSIETFGKPIFNSRDEIWLSGFVLLRDSPFFGTARFNSGYWHNSAIACLTAFGVVGYFFWIRLFYILLKEGQQYMDDTCVIGSMVAFVVLFCQQSVELGIFAPNPSLLPYMMLGVLLGRVGLLKERKGAEKGPRQLVYR